MYCNNKIAIYFIIFIILHCFVSCSVVTEEDLADFSDLPDNSESSEQTDEISDTTETIEPFDDGNDTSESSEQSESMSDQSESSDESEDTIEEETEPNPEPEIEPEPDPTCRFDYTVMSGTSIEIGTNLTAGYEPSGAVWHERLELLFIVSDEGYITSLTKTDQVISEWYIGGDLEGITVADPETDLIYIGVENPDSIIEFDIHSGTATRTFLLTSIMTGASNQGLEALTFYPDEGSEEGGYFFAGLQADGYVYVFELPLLTSDTSTSISFERSFAPVAYTDLSGMHYDVTHDILYLVYDGYNKLVSYSMIDDTFESWTLLGDNQEGFTIDDECSMYVSEDDGNVKRYL
jgi:hypothetical protein